MVSIEELRLDPANPRRISDEELEGLTRSLRTFGFVDPALARRADRTVIAGHQRIAAALRLGHKMVPTIFLDLTTDQARILGVALNKLGGHFDDQLLARLLGDIRLAGDVDLTLTGFGEDELRTLLRSLDARDKRERPESFDLDAAIEAATRAPRTKRGDMIALGEHRLLCGDATKPDDVARLLGGRRASLCVTDPPYNVRYLGGPTPGAKRRRPIANDDLEPGAFEAFVRGWARNLLGSVDGALYVFTGSKELARVSRILAEEGGHWSDTICWAKGAFTIGRAPYQRAYEPIWFGWREDASPFWCGARDKSDLWEIPRPIESPLHPAQKPLALFERAIENSSRSGDLLLDLFAGSGSSLVACERTGRLWAGLELDRAYCDVAAARWSAFTGGEPRWAEASDPADPDKGAPR